MTEHRIRHLPIALDHEIIGMVSMRDVLEHRLNEMENKSKMLMRWLVEAD
jgi:signal-transduction protein with cAMP-binding, CBS, and nucleotidyltransferase domain